MTDIFSHPATDEARPVKFMHDEGYTTFLAAEHAAEAPDAGLPVPVMEGPPADAPPAPAVLFAGTHVVYDDGQGGVVLVIQDREGNSIQKHLPAGLLRLAEKMTGVGGGGMGALGALFGKG